MILTNFVKPNNEHMKDYDKKKESSYRRYWDVYNLYEWAMFQKLPTGGFMQIEYLVKIL